MAYMKRALKRDDSIPVGIPAPMHLDCECGQRVDLPEVKGLPMTHVCGCGIEYNAQGWIVRNTPPLWNLIANEWYGVDYRQLPDDGAQQEAVVTEAERRTGGAQ